MSTSGNVAEAPSRARRHVPWGIVALLAVVALFAAGLVHLFDLRFDVGDVYPPYSTLRSDPLGAKVLENSLAALPGIKVERSLRKLANLGREPLRPAASDNGERDFTCFLLGVNAANWPYLLEPEAVDRLETIMRRGGRVVITFQPAQTAPTFETLAGERLAHERAAHGGLHGGPAARENARKFRLSDLIVRWGVDFRRRAAHPPGAGDRDPRAGSPSSTAAGTQPEAERTEYATPDPGVGGQGGRAAAFAAGSEAVAWHSALDFRIDTVPALLLRWQRLYERRQLPVIVSRPFGLAGGELILASDSYFLSNEGLRDHPSPALIAALIGGRRHVIFDESHLGVNENPGLVTLARRYRLQGAIAAIALLLALYLWRNVVSLVPTRSLPDADGEGADGDTVLGQAAASGYLNLLRRGVRPRELAGVCVEQWEAGAPEMRGSPGTALEARARVRAVLSADRALPVRRRASPASAYRAMCDTARQKSFSGRRR